MSPQRESNWPFRIWLVATITAVLIIGVLATAALVRSSMNNSPKLTKNQAEFIRSVAAFPGMTRIAILELIQNMGGDPGALLIDRQSTEKPHWVRHFPAPEDPGYLLFSGVDPEVKRSIVKLIRIADGKVMARWLPNWNVINGKITGNKWGLKGNSANLRAVHPVLLMDGDIVFNAGNALIRMNSCATQPNWVLDQIFHHSNELALDGQSIWTPSISQEAFANNPWLHEKLRDDSLARVSLDGKVLENRSFAKILIENGMRELLLGRSGTLFNEDPIHLNQISVAHGDSKYWKRGDLLISARHLSRVFLYRPSSGQIIWHQQGPWMNQHSARFVDDHRISIFSNNVYGGAPVSQPFVSPGEINQVFVYDFNSKQATQPYAALLAIAKPVTMTEGRAEVLADGGLFLEETNFGRQLRFTKDTLLWSRVNDYDAEHIGMVSWSRYLSANEVSAPLKALASRQCGVLDTAH